MRDLRDPSELGAKLLDVAAGAPHISLCEIADHAALHVRDYRDETTIEKYGDPRLLPSTLPN